MAFSNARIYDGALTTFPGVIRDDCLRHVVVARDGDPGDIGGCTPLTDHVGVAGPGGTLGVSRPADESGGLAPACCQRG